MFFEFNKPKSKMDKPKILSQHVDSLEVTFKSLDEKAHANYVNTYLQDLEYVKEEAQEIESFNQQQRYIKVNAFDTDTSDDFGEFRIFAMGQGQYKVRAENDDIKILLSSSKFDSDAPLIKVEFRAHYLFAVGHLKAVAFVSKLITKLLGTNFSSSIQRIDIATDVWGVKLELLDTIRFQNSFKSTVHKQGSKLTGLTFGGGDFMFRIYDKLEQIKLNYSRHYVKSKWAVNGFDESFKINVTRFEAQFRRAELKKYLPQNLDDELGFLFSSLSGLWVKALSKIKYAPLSNEECIRIVDGNMLSATKRQIFKRARDNEERYQFQNFLRHWDNEISDIPLEYKDIKAPTIETPKRQLKGFIAGCYKAGLTNPDFILEVIDEVQLDLLLNKKMTLHQYGLAKTIDSFIYRQKQLEKYGVTAKQDYTMQELSAFVELKEKVSDIDNVFLNMPNIAPSDNVQDFFDKRNLEVIENFKYVA